MSRIEILRRSELLPRRDVLSFRSSTGGGRSAPSRFRTCPKTYRPPCGRLRLRKTARKGSVACQGPDRWHPLKAGGEEVPIVNMRWRELTGGAASPGHRG